MRIYKFFIVNYLTFKVVVGDDPGALAFRKLSKWWESMEKLDETYFGPEHYWSFFQLGSLKQQTHIIKWEIWSNWYLKNNFDVFNKAVFVGVSCGLFFYVSNDSNSYKQLKITMNTFFEKRRDKSSPFFVVATLNPEMESIDEEERENIESNGGKIIPIADHLLDSDIWPILVKIFKIFIQELQPKLSRTLNIEDNFKMLTLSDVQSLLFKTKYNQLEHIEESKVEIPLKEKTQEIISELSEEELEKIAISPTGEILEISKDISKTEIVELASKGYKLPKWIVVPRHCPHCLNQNQRIIHEITDKGIILMDYPKIYGKKYTCGNCGNNWH